MREKDFNAAYDDYSQALAIDSGKSLAWHGLSVASVGRDSLPITELIRLAKSLGNMKSGDSVPMMKASDSIKNRYYKPLLRLQSILMRFQRRDSLGRTDGVYPCSRENDNLIIASNLGLLFKLSDLNRDTIIDARDNLLKGAFDSMGKGGLKPGAIAADSFLAGTGGKADTTGTVNPQKVTDFNTFLTGMTSDLSTNKTILDKVSPPSTSGSTTGSDTSSSSQTVNQQLQTFLDNTGNSVSFWKMNDSVDNDGDGCIDEEIWGDKKDNDGDGLVDEDSRIAYLIPEAARVPGQPMARAPEDGILNDRQQLAGDSLKFVSGTDDGVKGFWTYADESGRTVVWAGLKWVDPKTDSVFTRLRAASPTATEADIVYKARITIRQQILALPPNQRMIPGAARVGGCWSLMLGGAQ